MPQRSIRILLLMMLAATPLFARGDARFRLDAADIRALEKSGHLVKIGADAWKTRGGALLTGRDPGGLTRLEHIMRHTVDAPGRPKHGVFSIGRAEVIELLDRVIARIRTGSAGAGKTRGDRMAYTVDAGSVVGYLGGREGKKRHHPKLTRVRLVVKKGAMEVVTFFPVK